MIILNEQPLSFAILTMLYVGHVLLCWGNPMVHVHIVMVPWLELNPSLIITLLIGSLIKIKDFQTILNHIVKIKAIKPIKHHKLSKLNLISLWLEHQIRSFLWTINSFFGCFYRSPNYQITNGWVQFSNAWSYVWFVFFVFFNHFLFYEIFSWSEKKSNAWRIRFSSTRRQLYESMKDKWFSKFLN